MASNRKGQVTGHSETQSWQPPGFNRLRLWGLKTTWPSLKRCLGFCKDLPLTNCGLLDSAIISVIPCCPIYLCVPVFSFNTPSLLITPFCIKKAHDYQTTSMKQMLSPITLFYSLFYWIPDYPSALLTSTYYKNAQHKATKGKYFLFSFCLFMNN